VGETTVGPAVFTLIEGRMKWSNRTETLPATNKVFKEFLPGTLSYLVWTNFIANTNGREMQMFSERRHTEKWPAESPVLRWNTNSLVWGMRGFTALSPCWEQEGSCGQVAVTALTRRHAYARGHGMGPEGFRTQYAGKKVWFLTAQNDVVERRVVREVVRAHGSILGDRTDYSIVLLDRDLPATITPLRVTGTTNLSERYPFHELAPHPIFSAEQSGNVSAEVPGFKVNIYKGGDSGAPNLLPLPGELVFTSGRTTSGPSRQMQADMDELCRLQGLKASGYQMQWVDLSGYPKY
jgi:hypothetical protein